MTPIGRDAELTHVMELLRERRLVTLVGPGGIGKTTIAKAAVERCRDAFAEGVYVVDLTLVDTADGVGESFAGQLGYSSLQALLDAPGDHPALLLVDNCEHVVDAVAVAIERLLDACEMPTVLATSRSALEVPGEVVVPLGPLEMPPPRVVDGPAVQLFVARATDAGAPVEATEGVAELCRRLDGVPLAIELAAARTRSMTPEEILDRLRVGLDVLDRPRRRSAARHQSLRAAIDWSYELLSEPEQRLFARLGVFAGPFTVDLAHIVTGDADTTPATVQDQLDSLVAASMVVARSDGTTSSYRLLETIRTQALAHLEEAGERRTYEARFVDHVVDRATGIIARGASDWSSDALNELLDEYGNISGAVRWCVEHDRSADRALVLIAVLWGVVHQAHTEDVGRLAEAVLDRWSDTDHPLRADAIATRATCLYMLGDVERAIELAREGLAVSADSPFAPATLWRAIAQARRAQGDTDGAMEAFVEAGGEARRLGLAAMVNESECARAQILADTGHVAEALDIVYAVRVAASAVGNEVSATWARTIEGSIRLRTDPARAVTVLDEAVEAGSRIGYPAAVSVGLRARALALLLLGDELGAAGATLELLDLLLGAGSTSELRAVLDVASPTLARAGRLRAARDLAATALGLPVVSITASIGHELIPLEPGDGTALSVRDAILLTQAELGDLLRAEAESGEVSSGTDAEADTDGDRDVGRTAAAVLRRTGDMWEIGWAGETVSMRTTKGLVDLSRLLAEPGRERHCLELIGGAVDEAGTGPVLDTTARRAYEDRVRELQLEVDGADADHDAGRAERARMELDAIVDELTAALGLGGRDRTGSSSAERARSTVTQRIRATMRRIDDLHPRLGRHLRASIRTGTFCSYQPEEPVHWEQ